MVLVRAVAVVMYDFLLRVNEWTAPSPQIRALRRSHRLRWRSEIPD